MKCSFVSVSTVQARVVTFWVTVKGHCLGTYSLLRKQETPWADSDQALGPWFPSGFPHTTGSNLEIWAGISQKWQGEARKLCFPKAFSSLMANSNQARRSSEQFLKTELGSLNNLNASIIFIHVSEQGLQNNCHFSHLEINNNNSRSCYIGQLSASCLVQMIASPVLEKGNNLLADPHSRHQAGANGKGSQAAKNLHIFLLFPTDGALLSDCTAQFWSQSLQSC